MSTSQDEIMELVDFDSPQFLPTKTTTTSILKSDTSEAFLVKTKPAKQQPVAKPRNLIRKDTKTISSTDVSEQYYDSKSEAKSYRDKLKERFKSVKHSVVGKQQRAKNESRSVLNLNRSIDAIQKENQEIDADLKIRKPKRNEDEVKISRAEKYHFFCELNQNAQDDSKQNTIEQNSNKSTEELIETKNEALTCFLRPENQTYFMKFAENELLWIPERSNVELHEKLYGEQPRYLEEEGIYVKDKLKVPSWCLNLLERRLLQDERNWFNCQGDLEVLENPSIAKCCKAENSLFPHHLTNYLPATTSIPDVSLNSIFVPTENVLDLYIHTLKFNHHPLFSMEHVYKEILCNFYDCYRQKIVANNIERITRRIEALRSVLKNGEGNKTANYKNEVKALQDLLFKESQEYRNIVKSILETWKAIKESRKFNSYSNTSVKLTIKKEKCNFDTEKRDQKRQIQEIVTEIIREKNLEYKKELNKYKEEVQTWKQHEKDVPKPKKPSLAIDEDEIREEIEEKFKNSLKPPGEPILHFTLNYDNEPTDPIEEPKEKQRRKSVSTTKLFLKIFCNQLEVCKTKTILLNDTFTCFFDETVSIQASTVPENILVEIYEQTGTLLKRKVGSLQLQVPSNEQKSSNLLEAHFDKAEIVHYKHTGVGSGFNLEDDKTILNTSGFLTYNLRWSNLERTNVLDEAVAENTLEDILNEDGTINVTKLDEWTLQNNLDPQDPKNSILFEYINEFTNDFHKTYESKTNYFRCNQDLIEFCSMNEIETNLRFQVLQLRDRNEPEFVGLPVPNRIKEIPINILADYKKRLNENIYLQEDGGDDDEDDEIDSKRSRGSKYIKQIHVKVFQNCRCSQNNLDYEDVVDEKMVFHLESVTKTIFSNVYNWLTFQNIASKPIPKYQNASKETIDDFTISRPKISITIISGTGIPQINDMRDKEASVKPFLVFTYETVCVKSKTSQGSDPRWEENLIMNLETSCTDYLNPSSLNGSISIDLYDEQTTNENLQENIFNNWLGNFQIPISAICASGNMQGSFEVNKPVVLLGYEQEYSKTSRMAPNKTFINLSIALEPKLPRIHPNMEDLPSNEPPYLRQYILKWNRNFNSNYPFRKFSALAIDSRGKTVCLTRFLRPLEPPQINKDGFDSTAEQCARFVSMIPFTDANKFYENVWLTTEQFLKITIGSLIDHAIALTCYLMALNLEPLLLIGFGLPQGQSAYVLLYEFNRETQETDYYIYDVTKGNKHHLKDVSVPLQKIYCLINDKNIWANIQKTNEVILTRFDLTRRSDWLPLFSNNNITAPTNTLQQKVEYYFDDLHHLSLRIEKKIRKKFTKLRHLNRTIWNHSVSGLFKKSMAMFETQIINGSNRLELHPELRNFFLTHKVKGYVINLPYKNMKAVIEFVKRTEIHMSTNIKAEYAVAVHVHSYSNQVIVVWILLATIVED